MSDDDYNYIKEIQELINDIDTGELTKMQKAFQAIRDKHFDKTTSKEVTEYFDEHITQMLQDIDNEQDFIQCMLDNYHNFANQEDIITFSNYIYNQKMIKELPEKIKRSSEEYDEIFESYRIANSKEYKEELDVLRNIIADDVQELIEVENEISHLKAAIIRKIDKNIN